MESESFKETKYFQYLIKNSIEIEKQRINFNSEFLHLIGKPTDEMAIILKSHLILEYYLDKYLEVAFPSIEQIKHMRLRFAQKVEMANCKESIITIYYTSLKELNQLRNKYAHNLHYQLNENDISEIMKIMKVWYSALRKPEKKGPDLIIDFTMWVCASIDSTIEGIIKESKHLGITGYISWLKEMGSAK